MRVNYRTISDLADACLRFARKMPRDVDLIVGVPRSGLLAANLVSLYSSLPYLDVDSFLDGRMASARGRTGRNRDSEQHVFSHRHVLVLDDSVASGQTMRSNRSRFQASEYNGRLTFGAIYVRPEVKDLVDVHEEVLYGPRLFEWNILNHYLLDYACVDLDGVLCRDPTSDENDDSVSYARFMAEVEPEIRLDYRIGWIITSRLERYREQTVSWLEQHNIEFRELIMLDQSSARLRRESNQAPAFKADWYRSTGAILFIESSLRQAAEISYLAKRDVFCTDSMQMIRFDEGFRLERSCAVRDYYASSGPVKGAAKKVLPKRLVRELSGLRSRFGR